MLILFHPVAIHFPMPFEDEDLTWKRTRKSRVSASIPISKLVSECESSCMGANEIKNMLSAITLRLFQYPEEGNGRKIVLSKYTRQQHQRENGLRTDVEHF